MQVQKPNITCCNDNMRGLVLSLAAGRLASGLGPSRSRTIVHGFQLRITVNICVVSSEDAVGVELPSVIRQLESFFRSFLRILDLT